MSRESRRKISPQGRAGRRNLRYKIEVECVEPGCHRKLYVNRGNAVRPVRCEEHKRLHHNKQANDRKRRIYQSKNYDPTTDSRLDQLRSFTVRVKCRNDFCDTLVETDGLTARNPKGVYCDDCRAEAKRIDDRNYYANRGRRLRQKKREEIRLKKASANADGIAA